MRFLLGTKGAMQTHYSDDGTAHAVTRVHAGPCVVTQVKSSTKDGAAAVQIGFQTMKKLSKPQKGHLKDLPELKRLREFRVDDPAHYQRGQELTVTLFTSGDHVRVSGISKGQGFQGVVKRHGFSGSPASHGHKDQLRMPGSIGPTGPARVFKGMRMPGRMGGTRVSVKELEILEIDTEQGTLLIKGALPGPRGGLLEILATGDSPSPEKTTDEAPQSVPEKKSDQQAKEAKK